MKVKSLTAVEHRASIFQWRFAIRRCTVHSMGSWVTPLSCIVPLVNGQQFPVLIVGKLKSGQMSNMVLCIYQGIVHVLYWVHRKVINMTGFKIYETIYWHIRFKLFHIFEIRLCCRLLKGLGFEWLTGALVWALTSLICALGGRVEHSGLLIYMCYMAVYRVILECTSTLCKLGC